MTTPGEYYRTSRLRFGELLGGLDADQWIAPVPACPGWRVRDVVAHLAAIVEDALAGTGQGQGPPSPEVTAQQVERHRDADLEALVDGWFDGAPAFEAAITAREIWPGAIDLVTHEHDVRGALDAAGFRDDEIVRDLAQRLMRGLRPNVAVRVVLTTGADDEVTIDRARDGVPVEYTLTTTPFEAFRFGMGRRTVDQIRALDWSADPGPDLAGMWVFGPAVTPIVE